MLYYIIKMRGVLQFGDLFYVLEVSNQREKIDKTPLIYNIRENFAVWTKKMNFF